MLTLDAAGPNSVHRDKLQQFGRFVGQWDLVVTWFNADGSVERQMPGEWEFGYALEGRSILDVWVVPPRDQRPTDRAEAPGEYGLSVRFYDPRIEAWRSTWHGPVNGVVLPFIARAAGDDMVLEREENGEVTRWMFTEITADSFHWLNVVSGDEGRTWVLKQDMRAIRRTRASTTWTPTFGCAGEERTVGGRPAHDCGSRSGPESNE